MVTRQGVAGGAGGYARPEARACRGIQAGPVALYYRKMQANGGHTWQREENEEFGRIQRGQPLWPASGEIDLHFAIGRIALGY